MCISIQSDHKDLAVKIDASQWVKVQVNFSVNSQRKTVGGIRVRRFLEELSELSGREHS